MNYPIKNITGSSLRFLPVGNDVGVPLTRGERLVHVGFSQNFTRVKFRQAFRKEQKHAKYRLGYENPIANSPRKRGRGNVKTHRFLLLALSKCKVKIEL